MERLGGSAAQRPPHSIALLLALTGLLSLAAVAVSGGLPTPRTGTLHTPHAPIRIQSNAEFTTSNGVVGGHGTPDDPYLIAGWEITNVDTMEAIFIRDTDASFIIRDVFVHQPPGLGFAGIRFIEVSNGRVDESSNVTLAANSLSNNQFQGMLITASSNLTIESNDLSRDGAGLWLSDSLNATVRGNTFDHDGLVVVGSSVPTRSSHSIAVDNLVNGKPIRYFKEESGLVVDGLDIGQLIVVDSTDVSIENVSADHADVGLELAHVQGASIRDSNFSYNDQGIFVTDSSEIVFAHVSVWFTNQTYLPSFPAKGSGVHVASSRNVTVSLSNLSRNERAGLFVDRPSENVTVSDSALINNSIAIQVSSVTGLTMTGDRFDRNSAGMVITDSKDVVLRDSDIERSIWSSAGFMSIMNLTVIGNRIAANMGSDCVRLTHILTVAHNAFESNQGPGLCLDSSFDADITDNRFANNTGWALLVYSSERIQTFGNAFADNYISNGSQASDSSPNPNVWDGGYPSGGNFWSNYRGADQCSGPGQDVCNGPDGIGDIPYAIQVRGADRYPLMRPPHDDTVPPLVGITSPADGATVNASSIAVTGIASDSGGSGLRVVKVRVSGEGWYTATGLVDWTASATLVSGSNRIDAQAWDNAGNPSAIASVNVTFTPPPPPPPTNTPPYANFSWSPASGDTSTVFTFTSTSFDAQDPPNLLQIRWDWQTAGAWDTPWSPDATAQHQFAVPGTYNVTMEAKDTGGLTGNQTATVSVTPTPPPPPPPLVVEITASPNDGTMPLTVSFTSSVTGGVAPDSYGWEFGGGSKSNAANPGHIYVTGGNFTAWLNATDNAGTSVQSAVLFVNVAPAVVNLTVTPPTRFVEDSTGISVNFTASVTGGTPPYTYHWDFGDGGQSDAPKPTHAYSTTGDYRVHVNVTDDQR